jgi:hypothetical protein
MNGYEDINTGAKGSVLSALDDKLWRKGIFHMIINYFISNSLQ